jgi:hypothetical protein
MFRAQAFPTLRCLITVAVDVRRRGKPATPPHDLLDCVFARGAWKGEL